MKVVYVAKHDQRSGNDDEGAIAHAFRVLGHEVVCFDEKSLSAAFREAGDFLLFHHLSNAPMRLNEASIPTVFWYFDLVNANDYSVAVRSKRRMNWITSVTRQVSAGFCTDGDWGAQDNSGKLTWLTQGADERIVGRGTPIEGLHIPILFAGSYLKNGRGRQEFVYKMKEKYGKDFVHITGEYRERLRDYIASSDIVVCPNEPITSRYASNRVYLSAGFGGCVLHPYCQALLDDFSELIDVLQYESMESLFNTINYLLDKPHIMETFRECALGRVKKQHLYRHRIEKMLQVLKTKGII